MVALFFISTICPQNITIVEKKKLNVNIKTNTIPVVYPFFYYFHLESQKKYNIKHVTRRKTIYQGLNNRSKHNNSSNTSIK